MALREHFESSGRWLFTRRGFLPLVLFAVLFLGLHDFHPLNGSHADETGFELLCFALGLAGQVVRAYAIGHVATQSSGNGRRIKAISLNTTGLYSVVRHPLYLGSFVMWISAALLTRNVWVVAVTMLAFWVYYERIMFAEEEFLRQEFGPSFEHWAKRTPAFLPAFRLWQAPTERFNWRRVLRRERSGFAGLVLTYVLFDAYIDFGDNRGIPDRGWLILLGVTLVLYLLVELDRIRLQTRSSTANAVSFSANVAANTLPRSAAGVETNNPGGNL